VPEGRVPRSALTHVESVRHAVHPGVYDLIRVEDDRYIFSAGPDREVQLTRDLSLVKVVKGSRVLEFTPPARPPWPLELGKVERELPRSPARRSRPPGPRGAPGSTAGRSI